MSLPDPTFQPGDTFTADNANGIINAILAKIQAQGFDSINQSGNITVLTHNVSPTQDEILRIDSYLLIRTYDGSNPVIVSIAFTDVNDGDDGFETGSGSAVGFFNIPCFTLKVKRGTVVNVNVNTGGDTNIYDIGGALIIEKLVS